MNLGEWSAAREFEVQAGIVLRLRIPTVLQMRRCAALAGGETDGQLRVLLQEPLPAACVIGWRNVPANTFGGEGDGDLPFTPAAIEAVLDRYPAAADEAYKALLARYGERQQQFEAAAGN